MAYNGFYTALIMMLQAWLGFLFTQGCQPQQSGFTPNTLRSWYNIFFQFKYFTDLIKQWQERLYEKWIMKYRWNMKRINLISIKGVKITAIDAILPSALLLHWEKLSIKGKVPEGDFKGDFMKYIVN